MPIDTTKVADRRRLRFDTPAGALADAESIAAADRAGRLRRAGNWTAGQCLSHVAAWIDYPFDGFPPDLRVPEASAVEARTLLPRILADAMEPGITTPGAEHLGGAFGADDVPTDEALDRLRRAWKRLLSTRPPLADPYFGPLSHEQWIAINLRHAELHQSFQHPG
ncbi:MAG: DUF1569 domain-containing protein [Phycisphaeraceae bacterium]|nr:DUF1569 domain-containing protein [Phycisphaeraceae bacterium]